MIISKTPYRISFFGGGTDYPKYYSNNKSTIISTTINHYSYITIKDLPEIFKYKYRIRYFYREEAKNIRSIKHPVIKSALKYLKIQNSLDIVHHGDLPARTGIGSSSSFTVGILNALEAYKNNNLTKKKLAEKSIYLEQKILRENVGSQDQVAAVYGGFNIINFYKNKFTCKKIIFAKSKKKKIEKYLQLYYIKNRNSQNIEKDKIVNLNKNRRYNKKINNLSLSACKLLKSNNNKFFIKNFGKLLNQQWELKKKLSNRVSSKYIDFIYDTAIKNGALGGKILGAGGGGFLMMIVPPKKQKKIIKLLRLPTVKVKFEETGSKIIYKN